MATDHTTPTLATRLILALVDSDLDAAATVLADSDDMSALAVACAQFAADRTTPADAANLVQLALKHADGLGGDDL